jgi:hypothetical protein
MRAVVPDAVGASTPCPLMRLLVFCHRHSSPAGIPALVAGIHRVTSSSARGWLDIGDKPRYDNRVRCVFESEH